MRARGYYTDPEWDWFPSTPRTPDDDARDSQKARENSPREVLGQMAFVLAVSLAIVVAINLALLAL